MSADTQRISQNLEDYWQALSPNWSAEIKSTYYHDIMTPLIDFADEVYFNNRALESYSETCLNSL